MPNLHTPSPAAPDERALDLAATDLLRAADRILVARRHADTRAESLRAAMVNLNLAAAALGHALSPLPPAPVQPPATAESLYVYRGAA